MKLNITPFRRAHKELVCKLYLEGGINNLALYCATSLCPVIAAYWFCREVDPDNLELTKRIESVKLFYGITEVCE
jgi:hypothetical protein